VVIRGLRQLLAGSRYRVVWHASSRETCLEAAGAQPPDVIVLDLRLGDDLAPDVLRDLRSRGVVARVVILTGHDDRELVNSCLAAGVAGVLFKDTGDLDIARSLDRVVRGQDVFDARLADDPAHDAKALAAQGASVLTTREYEVLRLVARGMTSRDIASELCLSINTVRSYVQSTLLKLNAHTRIEAVRNARRLRML
jgi:DNA-binding NarL/FixJ family response regulator